MARRADVDGRGDQMGREVRCQNCGRTYDADVHASCPFDSPRSRQFEFCSACSRIYDTAASPHCPYCHSIGAAAPGPPTDAPPGHATTPNDLAKSAPSRRAYWRGEGTGKRILVNALILTCCTWLSFLFGVLLGKIYYSASGNGRGVSLGALVGIAIAVLFIASLLCWRLLARRSMRRNKRPRLSKLQKMTVAIAALGIMMAVRTLLFQPFNIPAGGALPTLLVGDYIFASKYSYGYSHFSLPFSPPLFSGRIMASQPRPGDVAIFRDPTQTASDSVARIVGLPGDRIQVIDGVVQINGTPVRREPAEDFVGEDPCTGASRETVRVKQWRETLPNGVSYYTLQCAQRAGFPNTTRVYAVPPGHYFLMGDNRDNSEDSRFADVGFVPFENLVGRVVVILWPNIHRLALSRSAFL
jgi:signal peptidase I